MTKISKDEKDFILQLKIVGEDSFDEATNLQMQFQTPRENIVTESASFHTDGTDNLLNFTVEEDNLGVVGVWRVRAKYVISGGTKHTTWAQFEVVT